MAEDLKLPMRPELEQIYLKKGKDALVWLLWRNAIRALLLLCNSHFIGGLPTSKVTLSNIYFLFQTVIFMSLYPKYKVIERCKESHLRVKLRRIYDLSPSCFELKVVIHSLDKLLSTVARARSNKLIWSVVNLLKELKTNKSLFYSLINDFNYLVNNNEISWHKSINYTSRSLSDFSYALKLLKMDFIIRDYEIILSGGEVPDYFKNYLKDLSDTITSDPIALRRAILGEETEQVQAVRVLLLGSGGAGKSSLADRLQANPIEAFKPNTQGIDYLNHQSLKLEQKHPDFKLETNDLDLYLWDFGGQTIFHGLHSAFLHENCVYVLVVDSRHEQAPDEWLHQIRHLAGNQANILLITNEYENCKTQQNQKRLLREFPDLLNDHSFFYFSCLTPESGIFKIFLEKLIQVSSESRRAIFKSTLDIRDELNVRYQSEVFLNLDEVEEVIADKVEIAEYRPSTLTQLEQLGFIIPTQGEKYCLNPVWVVDNAYKLLYSDEVRNNHGTISLNAIRKILNCSDRNQAEILVRDLLQERALCCAISKTEYFFPDAASTNEPDQATKIIENPILTLRFDVPYLPLGFYARLVHKLYQPTQTVTIQNTNDIWRQGFILKVIEQKKIKAQAVIHYLLRKSAIEMVLNGEVEYFAALLETFYPQLEKALDTSAARQKIKIQILVSDDAQNLLAIPSGYKLIDALKRASTPHEIAEQVNKMTKENAINITTGAGSQIIIGDGNQQKANSNNTHQPDSVVKNPKPKLTLDSIKEEHKQLLLEKLQRVQKDYYLETRAEEKMRLEAVIDEVKQRLTELEG